MADGAAPRMRPAHAPGPTYVAYTPNGRKLITAGSNDSVRVFQSGSNDEPTNVDDCSDSNLALVATNDFFIIGSEDGSVSKYSLETKSLDTLLTRCSLPIRDLALSPDGEWVAVASDELTVKVVNTRDMTRVKYCRDQPKPAKHVSFDYAGTTLAVSSADGQVYFYDLSIDEAQLVRKMDGLIRPLETDDTASSLVAWHPDGRAFAAPTATRDIQVVSKRDWERQRSFKNGHNADITAFAWSPNGSLLVTAAKDNKIVLWSTKTQRILHSYNAPSTAAILSFSWHPTENTLSYTTAEGELFIHTDFVPSAHAGILDLDLQAAPFIHDPLQEISGNAQRIAPRDKDVVMRHDSGRGSTPDSLDDILGPTASDDDFIEDDDGAGYGEPVVNGYGKRTAAHLPNGIGRSHKRHAAWSPQIHESFQPGSTPWRGNRRYLCLNLTGAVWTVDQDTHHTVTVEFYDHDVQRDFHFTDPNRYDKAVLSEKGALFASSGDGESKRASVYYRPHSYWTPERADWRADLPKGEMINAMALSDGFVVIATSTGYIRVYTLFGVPVRMYRAKNLPVVSCAAWRDYIFIVGNGAVGSDGMCKLVYWIENVRRDEIFQAEDGVALAEGEELRSVFWSDAGDPCIYDTAGVLLTLQHWRTPGQARWVPLLDTKLLPRLASGRKDESYWPVAAARDKFYCIILKGGDRYPYFPRPLLNDFDLSIPIQDPLPEPEDGKEDDFATGIKRFQEAFVRTSLLHSLAEDTVAHTHASHEQKQDLAKRELDIDKVLLQLLAQTCKEGEESGMKALEIVTLLKDRSGRMLDAAGKIASRFERTVLREKIEGLAERRLVGLDDNDDAEDY